MTNPPYTRFDNSSSPTPAIKNTPTPRSPHTSARGEINPVVERMNGLDNRMRTLEGQMSGLRGQMSGLEGIALETRDTVVRLEKTAAEHSVMLADSKGLLRRRGVHQKAGFFSSAGGAKPKRR